MRTLKFTSILAAGALLCATLAVQAQKKNESDSGGNLDVALTYHAMLSNPVGGGNFWLQGGGIQLHGQFWRGLGEVADISGLHAGGINSSGTTLNLVTATFGPRYTWVPAAHHREAFYGQALLGKAFGFDSVFPLPSAATDSADSMAFVLGGGVNYALHAHWSVRAFEADWVRTSLPNSTTNVQNNLRLGAGAVLHF